MDNHIFGNSLFGYNKNDVQAHISELEAEYRKFQRDKENEIRTLKSRTDELETQLAEAIKTKNEVLETKDKITSVLMLAQQQAAEMIENAKNMAVDEKKQLDNVIESEKEKLVDMKFALKSLRREVSQTLKQFEENIEQMTAKIPLEEESNIEEQIEA